MAQFGARQSFKESLLQPAHEKINDQSRGANARVITFSYSVHDSTGACAKQTKPAKQGADESNRRPFQVLLMPARNLDQLIQGVDCH